MNNRTVLVTGGTDGIGKETALQLARKGASVLVHGRSQEKGARVINEINRMTGNEQTSLYIADFSSLTDVRQMAEDIKRDQNELHVLVNNAGNFYNERELSTDGFEKTFAVNYLAPFLMTLLLLDLVKSSTPARIINVSSSAHKTIKSFDMNNIQSDHDYDGFTAYSLSKLANLFFTYTLARKMEGTDVTVNALNPGIVDTALLRKSYALDGVGVEQGAETPVYLVSSPDVACVTGKYFDRMRIRPSSDLSQSKEIQDSIWDVSRKLVSKFLE